ncbi:MAG: PEP-CTERM sorting domain-containing protein, partial [Planctomycetota bacterium]
ASAEFLRELVIDDYSSVAPDSAYPITHTIASSTERGFLEYWSGKYVEELDVPGVIDGRRWTAAVAGPASHPAPPDDPYTASVVVSHDPLAGTMTFEAGEYSAARWFIVYDADATPFINELGNPAWVRSLDLTPYTHVLLDYESTHDTRVHIRLSSMVLHREGFLYPGPVSVGLVDVPADSTRVLVPLDMVNQTSTQFDYDLGRFVEQPMADFSDIDRVSLIHDPRALDDVPAEMVFTLDRYSFVTIPEPGAAAVLALGAVGLLTRRWRGVW